MFDWLSDIVYPAQKILKRIIRNDMLVKRVERRILESGMEPPSRSWLWLDLTSGVPVLKNYMNGKWTPLAGSSEDKPEPEPTDLTGYAKESWVVSRINSLSAFFNTKLSDYVKKSELPEIPDIQGLVADIADVKSRLGSFITLSYFNVELGKFNNSLSTTYQKKLTAGAGINIDGNNVIKSTLVIDKALSGTSTNPIENKAVKAAFDSVQSDIDDINDTLDEKENKLIPGDNISLSTAPSGGTVISASIMAPPGSEQVQASWTQTDSTSPDYIKNKPDLDTLLAAKQDVLVSGTNIKTINNQSLLGNGNIAISGGSGSGFSVDVVDEGDDTSDNNTLYFFSPSPLQAEGLYNNLLQNGQVNSVAYSPGILYNLNEVGGFNRIQNKNDFIRVEPETNRVYCCDQLTALKNVGDIVVSHKRKYADTSDTAYISMTVSKPFYQSSMNVHINVPAEDGLTIQRRTANGVWTNVDNGSYITFHNNRQATINNSNANPNSDVSPDLFDFRIIRADSNNDNYASRLETSLTFTIKYSYIDGNGVQRNITREPVVVEIIYPACKLFYKNGVTYPPFDFSTIPDITENSTAEEQSYLYAKKLYYNNSDDNLKARAGDSSFYLPSNTQNKKLAMRVGDVTVNMGNYNVFYAVVTSYYYSLSLCVYQSEYTEGINYGSSDTLWYTKSTSNDQEEKNNVEKRGSHVQKCVIQRVNQPYNLNLVLYLMHATSAKHTIKEVGLLTY